MTDMSKIARLHADAKMAAVERQRNEALSREASKDALVAVLQAQAEQIVDRVKALEADLAQSQARVAELEAQMHGDVGPGATKAA